MSTEVAGVLIGVVLAANVAIIRVLWRLHDRVARLEGRLNGRRNVS